MGEFWSVTMQVVGISACVIGCRFAVIELRWRLASRDADRHWRAKLYDAAKWMGSDCRATANLLEGLAEENHDMSAARDQWRKEARRGK